MEKVNYIFNHPMGMLSRIYLTIVKYGEALIWEIFGSQLAVRTVYIHPIFYFWYCFKVIEAGREFRLGEKEKKIILLAVGGGVLLVMLSLFVSWATFETNYITGIQGRYFIPMLPLGAILLSQLHLLHFSEKSPTDMSINKEIVIIMTTNLVAVIAIYLKMTGYGI